MVRRGLPDVAAEKFVEALELAPSYAPARLGLGGLHLRAGRLAEAELEYRTALAEEASSVDGRLGLAYVQVLRGGEELGEAETILREVLASNPGEPRARYLMGMVHEQRGDPEAAAASFRKAAELLMSQRGSWELLTREGNE